MLFPVLWRPSIAENIVLFYVSIRFALERQSQGGGIPTGFSFAGSVVEEK